MAHLPHLSGKRFTASAYCQARQRLPIELLQVLADALSDPLCDGEDLRDWHGHRVWMMDGSGISMPDTESLQAAFGQPGNQKPGCGFPVAHVLATMDTKAGFLRDVVVRPLRTQDIALVDQVHPKMSAGDIVLGDRGFCSYVHLALVLQRDLHGVFRMHQKQIVDFKPHRRAARQGDSKGRPRSRWIKRLGVCDQIVEWRKPTICPKWMSVEMFDRVPQALLVREIKKSIRMKGRRVKEITLVTTLLDADRYPAEDILLLYKQRWQIEVNLRDLKTTLGTEILKGKSEDVVRKEILVYVMIYNLIRQVMLDAAKRQKVRPDRISFVDAMRWLQPPKPSQPSAALMVNPQRSGRVEPRCVKRNTRDYTLMSAPRSVLRKRLKQPGLAA